MVSPLPFRNDNRRHYFRGSNAPSSYLVIEAKCGHDFGDLPGSFEQDWKLTFVQRLFQIPQ